MSDEERFDDRLESYDLESGEPEGADASEPGRGRGVRMAIFALLALLVGVAVAVAAVKLRPQPERRSVETPPPLVQVLRVAIEPVALDVPSQGTVEPLTESTLVAQVAGRVTAVADDFAAGAFFRAGQTLVEIDRRDYQLAVRDAEAALAQAEVGLEREQAEAAVARREWEELGRGGEPSPLVLRKPQLAQARAAVAAAEAAVERAGLNLQRTRLSAPFDGRVRAKLADLGQYVAPGTPLAELYSTSVAEVRLPVPQDDLAFLDVGIGWSAPRGGAAPSVVLSSRLAGRLESWTGRVVRTGAEIDRETRMLDVYARVDDPLASHGGGSPLPMGLFVEAEIAGRPADAALLPRRALRTTGRSGDDEVMVVGEDGVLRFRRVDVLRARGERVYVGGGLEDGELVVVSRLTEAVDGMRVRAEEVAPGSDPAGVAGESEDPESRL
ncbi:MAG TPA: efflux RND transporter periplasmic adaptor subunit [Thermoanaerobaculia bacterium]|nr:efflux RND transporter periplasmic adaptor subunit [Thermoanaerobaculia bacterium]